MRRDIAALWLAFSHQERTLRELTDRLGGPRDPQAQPAPGTAPAPEAADDAPGAASPAAPGQGPAPVSQQLSDLDDVLASIERATEALERDHADEIGGREEATEGSGAEPRPPNTEQGEDPAGPPPAAG